MLVYCLIYTKQHKTLHKKGYFVFKKHFQNTSSLKNPTQLFTKGLNNTFRINASTLTGQASTEHIYTSPL